MAPNLKIPLIHNIVNSKYWYMNLFGQGSKGCLNNRQSLLIFNEMT